MILMITGVLLATISQVYSESIPHFAVRVNIMCVASPRPLIIINHMITCNNNIITGNCVAPTTIPARNQDEDCSSVGK